MVRRPGPQLADAFRSPLRSPRLATQLGLALAAAFAVCFVTGLLSHLIQHPPAWFAWPSRPAQLYRITQGVHVATGLATIPLLGAKLWSVYPRLFAWPPVRDLVHAVERLSVAALVAAALFELTTGVLNVARWYAPMPFFFPAAHYWTAWLAAGAIVTHIGVKLPVIRDALRTSEPASLEPGRLTRRGLLGAVAATAGVITITTVGQTVTPLARLALLAPRRPRIGPQGLPVNTSAQGARVVDLARDPAYRLEVAGPARTVWLSLADLSALPQHHADLPIACVEGWSSMGRWAGVPLRDLAALVGVNPRRNLATVESLQVASRYRISAVDGGQLGDVRTLVALRLNGEPLHVDHGYPCRLIGPDRPGVQQTKWLARVTFREQP